jgi:hypothetical protein
VKHALHVTAVAVIAVASGCGASDLASLVREPTLGHVAYYLLLAPLLFIAKILVEQILGEALGVLVGRILPPWMKTRRALWTGMVLLSLVTLGAVAFWNLAGGR